MRLFKAGDKVRHIPTGDIVVLKPCAPDSNGRMKLWAGYTRIYANGTGHVTGILRVEHITKSKQMKSWVIK